MGFCHLWGRHRRRRRRRRLCVRRQLLQITAKGVKQKLFVLDGECNLSGEWVFDKHSQTTKKTISLTTLLSFSFSTFVCSYLFSSVIPFCVHLTICQTTKLPSGRPTKSGGARLRCVMWFVCWLLDVGCLCLCLCLGNPRGLIGI